MQLDLKKVPEEKAADFDLKTLNKKFLLRNRPVKVENLAKKWPALKSWDLNYLKAKAGFATAMTSVIYRNDDMTPWNRAMKQPITYAHSLEETINLIVHNGEEK